MRRRNAVVLVLTLLAVMPVPALAQEAGGSPGCPNVFFSVDREDLEGPPGVPVTLKGGSDVHAVRTPDRWTLTRISPGPAELVDSVEASAGFAFTVTVAETTTFRIDAVGPEGCPGASGSFTRTVTGALPQPVQDCSDGAVVSATARTITASQPVDLVLRTTSATPTSTAVDLEAVDARVGGRTVRTATFHDDGTTSFTVRPVFNTEFVGRQRPEPCASPVFGTRRAFVAVRPSLSLSATRNGPRDYTFSGRAFPVRAGQAIRLYRLTPGGGRSSRRPLGSATQAPGGSDAASPAPGGSGSSYGPPPTGSTTPAPAAPARR